MVTREHPTLAGYFIGDDGSVWTSKAKGGNDRRPRRGAALRPLRLHKDRRGYLGVSLDIAGTVARVSVHRLVLEAFVGPAPDGFEACHYPDTNPGNNALANLRWDSHAENMRDKTRGRGPVTEKACKRCGITKPRAEYYGDKRASDGLCTTCRPCHMAVSIATRDPDKQRARNRAYMQRSRAAAKASGAAP